MLVSLLIVILIVGLALWGVQQLPLDGRLVLLLQIVIVIAAILYLAGMI